MSPKINYEQQVSPGTLQVPDVPHVGNPSLVLGAINKTFEASQDTADAVSKIGGVIQKHAQDLKKLQDEKQASDLDTQFRRENQDKIYNPNTETIKVNGQDRERPIGIKDRQLSDASGSTDEYDFWYQAKRDQYLKNVKDPSTRAQLAKSMDSHFLSTREQVIGHESTEMRKDMVRSFQSNLSQKIKDASDAQDPLSLASALDNVSDAQDKLNRASNADQSTSELNKQKSMAATVDTAVTNKLLTTGNIDEAKALLQSAVNSIDADNFNKISLKLEKGAQSLQRINERAKTIRQNEAALGVLTGLADGSLNWTNLHSIDNLDVPDQFKMAAKAAVHRQMEDINHPRPKGRVNIDDAEVINTKDEAFASYMVDVLNSGNKEKIIDAMQNAMRNYGKGTISQDHLNILLNLAITRGANLPIASDQENGAQESPSQVPVDAGSRSLLNWRNQSGINDPAIFKDYLDGIKNGKNPQESYDAAIRAAVIKEYPNLVTHDQLPNMVIGKDSPIRVIFPRETTIYPNRIYDPASKTFKPNPNKEKSTKDKATK